tara:strand:- start:58 stop:279 length:222 start_codon:yes stop_codon:yes gene_type:complete
MDIMGLTTEQGMMGGVMFLLGVHQFGWLRENIGDFNIITLPMLGDLTPLKILGVGGLYFGSKMLYECCIMPSA